MGDIIWYVKNAKEATITIKNCLSTLINKQQRRRKQEQYTNVNVFLYTRNEYSENKI